MSLHSHGTALSVVLLLLLAMSAGLAQWTVTLDRPDGKGKPSTVNVWVPDGCKTVRGVLVAQPTMFEAGIMKNDEVRKACADKGIAIVYAGCGIGLSFVNAAGAKNMEEVLAAAAQGVGHPELEFAPIITLGHSTGGIYCRNVAYWKPERVAGVCHVMSGNLQAHVEDTKRTLAGVPVLFVNGEWEQYGPDGGDLKGGLRVALGLRDNPNGEKGRDGKILKEGQTQWVMMRQQIIARRLKNEDNVMGLIASRNCNHTTWEGPMNGMVAQFIRSVADLRIPKGDPDGKTVVQCLPVKASQGWLLDADIKAPKFQPAAHADYKGDKRHTLWFPDKAMAMKVWEYNAQGWKDADPTADWPMAMRYTPEPRLQDIVDSPPLVKLTWAGGDGRWATANWNNPDGKVIAWDPAQEAVVQGAGGVITAEKAIECSGLTLGAGYTLAIGTHGVDSRANITLEAGSTLEVTLTADEANGRWGARVWAAGNATTGGTLVLKGDNLVAGTYNIIRASGKTTGSFDKVVCPAGWTTDSTGGSIALKKAE